MSILLKTTALNHAFGSVIVADNIDFEISQGERLALIGQNGAGKTTFINICSGLIRPTSGHVYFDGQEITHQAPRNIVNMGMVRTFQLPQLFLEHTVRENMELAWLAGQQQSHVMARAISDVADGDRIDAMISAMNLAEQEYIQAEFLAEGQKKLLDVAMALLLNPKLLIMDEPTSGVSTKDKFQIMDLIMQVLDEQQITSIFVEHDVDIVREYSSRVAAWISGAVVADDTPQQVLSSASIKQEILGE